MISPPAGFIMTRCSKFGLPSPFTASMLPSWRNWGWRYPSPNRFLPVPSMRLTYNSYLPSDAFHTVKAILPERATGLAVAVGRGVGVLVGPRVALAVAVTVGVAVRTVVAVAVGVLVARVAMAVAVARVVGETEARTMGVQVGVGAGEGMTSTCPSRIRAGLVIPFASARASVLIPNLDAISDKVSPAFTVYVRTEETTGAVASVSTGVGESVGRGRGVLVAKGVLVAEGVLVASGVIVGVDVRLGVGVGVGV